MALQKQLLIPVTRMYLNKTTGKYSVDDSGTLQEQSYTPVTTKDVNKTTHNSVHDSVAPTEQLHSPFTRNYANKTRNYVNKTIKKHSEDDSVTQQEQSHSPVTRNHVNKTTEKHSVDDSVAPQEQIHIPITRKHVTKTTKKRSINDLAAAQEQLHSFVKRKYIRVNKNSVAPQEQLHIPAIMKHVNKTTEKHSVDDSVAQQEQSADILSKEGLATTESCESVAARLIIRPRERSKGSALSKSKILNEKELQNTTPVLENVLENISPLSDEQIKLCRRKIENMNTVIEDFKADISTLWPHHDDLCTDSDILSGGDPYVDDIINKCVNFESDLEAMMQQENKSEKLKHQHRTADLSTQNGSEIRCLQESRRSVYEENRSEASSPEKYRLRQKTVHNVSEKEFANPCLVRRVYASSSRDTSINLPEQLVSNIIQGEVALTDFETFTSDNLSYEPFHRADDDDDVLSLYAESISAMDSARLDSVASVSNGNLHDVPKYEDGEIITNADEKAKTISGASASNSSSSAKNKTKASGLLEDSNRTSVIAEDSNKRSEAQISSQPRRLFSSYQKVNPVRSSVYKGVCFFNILSQCRNSCCRFTHAVLNINTFKLRLQRLDDDSLIAEYLLMSVYESLKRNYYLLFVEECKRRNATRILFEMVIDIGLGYVSIDKDIRLKVLETALLHLNTISIDACDDLLKFEHKGTMMCDVLLSCMADSQNFTQFKSAFVKLTQLMCELNRPADIQVASSILERVCILPGEDLLARGMLALMKNTDASIFEKSLACSFEGQLANIDSDVHAAYLLAKKAALEGRLAQLHETYPTTPPIMPCVVLNAPRQTRPDTNNVENLHEPLPPVNSTQRRFVKPRRLLWRKSVYNTKTGYSSHRRNN